MISRTTNEKRVIRVRCVSECALARKTVDLFAERQATPGTVSRMPSWNVLCLYQPLADRGLADRVLAIVGTPILVTLIKNFRVHYSTVG